jgi:hypothetical protein
MELAGVGFVADPESRWASAWAPEAHPFQVIEGVPCLVLIGEPGSEDDGTATGVRAPRADSRPGR